uniref:Uncharacterized protein n=1 Tax=Oryza barthii TaxID=65489 RepID=A0A0D3EJH5_9ORYZ
MAYRTTLAHLVKLTFIHTRMGGQWNRRCIHFLALLFTLPRTGFFWLPFGVRGDPIGLTGGARGEDQMEPNPRALGGADQARNGLYPKVGNPEGTNF